MFAHDHLVALAQLPGAPLISALAHVPCVTAVRGFGPLLGFELATPLAKLVKVDAEQDGLLVNAIGESVLRLAPPLLVTQTQVDDAVAILEKVISRRLA